MAATQGSARDRLVELCGPFQGYVEDPNSLFLTLDLSASR
jgi:hypothetical protein